MENIRRKIKVFFADYGFLLIQIFVIIIIISSILRSLNNQAKEEINENNNSTSYQYIMTRDEQSEKNIEFISRFIELCNKKEINEAYNMISDESKQKYTDVDKFKKEYIDENFSVYICKYKVKRDSDVYLAILTKDMLVTGKQDDNIELKYKIKQEVLEKKIEIISGEV